MKKINLHLNGMIILSHLAESQLYQKYKKIFSDTISSCEDFIGAYCSLCQEIFTNGSSYKIWMDLIRSDDNALTQLLYEEKIPSSYFMQAVDFDLNTIQKIISIAGEDIIKYAIMKFPEEKEFLGQLPTFPAGGQFPIQTAEDLVNWYHTKGYGFFALNDAFCMHKMPEALQKHDPIRLSDLKGYKRQKDIIIANTKAFLQGQPANNILLYGDKGTGKSSTVKAIANYFAEEGLKIIELPSSELSFFPQLCQAVEKSPFKFIVFLDDLNFTMEDENFRSMKAFIEGGISGKPDNIIIYATSNRRHLVREGFRDREGDDIHLRDTIQSITALSDRFGLQITFTNPNKDEYLYIVDSLAEEYQIDIPTDEIHRLAESFALRKSGRSPRCARQFISDLLSKNKIII